jgi:hypothetical protein
MSNRLDAPQFQADSGRTALARSVASPLEEILDARAVAGDVDQPQNVRTTFAYCILGSGIILNAVWVAALIYGGVLAISVLTGM